MRAKVMIIMSVFIVIYIISWLVIYSVEMSGNVSYDPAKNKKITIKDESYSECHVSGPAYREMCVNSKFYHMLYKINFIYLPLHKIWIIFTQENEIHINKSA